MNENNFRNRTVGLAASRFQTREPVEITGAWPILSSSMILSEDLSADLSKPLHW
jgi:hypothetical protein